MYFIMLRYFLFYSYHNIVYRLQFRHSFSHSVTLSINRSIKPWTWCVRSVRIHASPCASMR